MLLPVTTSQLMSLALQQETLSHALEAALLAFPQLA
jgi:hypothetical protein